jgi:glycine cleavage system H lipoate-binding protein
MTQQASGNVLRRTVVRRERTLPIPGEVLVRVGQRVSPDTIVAKTEVLPGDPYVVDLIQGFRRRMTAQEVGEAMVKRVGERVKAGEPLARITRGIFGEVTEVKAPVDGMVEFISRAYGRVLLREDPKLASPIAVVNVARQLDVWPATIRMYMRYREGDEVKQGAPLADSPSVTGIDYSYSPISGIIEKIDTRNGTVTIVRPARPTMVEAYLAGRVDEVVPEHGVYVSCAAAYVTGVFGVGFETYGYLRVISGSPDGVVDAPDIAGELRDQILVAGAHVTLAAARKAAAGGARGIVCGAMDHLDLVSYVGQEIGVGITGQEDVPMSIILTEGFGRMPMAAPAFELLREHQGKLASANGSTQVRAGVIRPEIIIPLGDPEPSDDDPAETATPQEALLPGVRVRILRKPHFGQWGQVVEVPTRPERLETEAIVRVVHVRLDDGRRVTVPQSNVEVF